MNLQKAETLSSKIEELESKLDKIEDVYGEESNEWMKAWKEKVDLEAKFYVTVNPGSEIQFNEDRTQFRVVTEQNRGTKFW